MTDFRGYQMREAELRDRMEDSDDLDRTREPRWGACFYPRIDERDPFRPPYPDPLPGDYPDICIDPFASAAPEDT